MLFNLDGTITSTATPSLTATSLPEASRPPATRFCSPTAFTGTSRSKCASGPVCSASTMSSPGWLMSSRTVAMSGLPVTSTATDPPGVAVVPDAGLVIEMLEALALLVVTPLLAAPNLLALAPVSKGQNPGVAYDSWPGENPERVKLLELSGSLRSPFTRSITAGFATGPVIRVPTDMCGWSEKGETSDPLSPPAWLSSETMRSY